MDVCSAMHYVFRRMTFDQQLHHANKYHAFTRILLILFLFLTFRRGIPNPRCICDAHMGTREIRIHAVFLVPVTRMARVLHLVIVDASTRFWITPVPRILAVAWKRASRPPVIPRTRFIAPENGNYYVCHAREMRVAGIIAIMGY